MSPVIEINQLDETLSFLFKQKTCVYKWQMAKVSFITEKIVRSVSYFIRQVEQHIMLQSDQCSSNQSNSFELKKVKQGDVIQPGSQGLVV